MYGLTIPNSADDEVDIDGEVEGDVEVQGEVEAASGSALPRGGRQLLLLLFRILDVCRRCGCCCCWKARVGLACPSSRRAAAAARFLLLIGMGLFPTCVCSFDGRRVELDTLGTTALFHLSLFLEPQDLI